MHSPVMFIETLSIFQWFNRDSSSPQTLYVFTVVHHVRYALTIEVHLG